MSSWSFFASIGAFADKVGLSAKTWSLFQKIEEFFSDDMYEPQRVVRAPKFIRFGRGGGAKFIRFGRSGTNTWVSR
ncbi:unnamed protein product [Haemonchus placei]|uniref:Sulfotransfer_1 domain-containing protein n=1 Tax=Haemonchus placei TaxID=6290 RepID=A0A0N4WSM4_HAEPC|nr:unnamed protein product [Haemonchus placei]